MRSINPVFKLAGLLAVTFFLASRPDPLANFIVFALCLILMGASGARLSTVLKVMIPVAVAAFCMFMTGYRFSSVSDLPVTAESLHVGSSAMWNALLLSSRVLAFASLGLLFALTTDRIDLAGSFRRQLHVPQMFAYGLLAAWGIFPYMAREYRRTRAAFRARGLSAAPFSPAVLKPMLVKSVRWSDALSVAMESRGFSGRAKRTEYRPVRVRGRDFAFLALMCGALPAALVLFF